MQVNRDDPGCSYHWDSSYQRRGYKTPYSCCNGNPNSKGCTVNKWHVSDTGNLASQKEFVRTVEKPQPSPDGDYGVYALDCEMCYTTGGGELTRIAVISSDYKTVYETLVMPDNPILDYNTRCSGITEDDLVDVKTTLKDVQAFLLNLLSSKTILIGHDLDGDLRALGVMIHDTVIDTSVIFPHSQGPPFRRALKTLCQEYLKKSIRNGGVHNCSEDAIACM
ncbi:hypothetical protein DAPPUDRAFT_237744 [Daphnia pulex]|uniref:Exonuclease domain-containing protein n=1 Tax=Daphnia pulex TaxID=6669 RepID=E9G4A0_DAPPU|nr:hypothetical protein DAPPUDRAFT_237744 [Daphnia pulex]|eukprot:EFX85588.1 hypothetical protein DAPPUDRAFT_237744 [Daphnia pulex]